MDWWINESFSRAVDHYRRLRGKYCPSSDEIYNPLSLHSHTLVPTSGKEKNPFWKMTKKPSLNGWGKIN